MGSLPTPPSVGYTAVVTGASGFLASELVQQLLGKGYAVRATVRSSKDQEKVAHLKTLGEALSGTLTLHEADLLQPGAFDDVIRGADFLFHTASPYKLGVDAESLLKPAIEGTKNVMDSAVKSKGSLKRIILTSSFVAVVKPKKGPSNGKFFTEEDWNDEAQADKETGYYLSKTLAEKEAWRIAEGSGLDLVTILPTAIFGPVLSSRVDASSVQMVKAIIEGGNTLFPWQCDIRDIARAHVLAAENPEAKGRYIVGYNKTVPDKAVIDILAQRFPQYKFATTAEDGAFDQYISTEKVERELGLQISSWKAGLIDMAVSLINRGLATPVAP